jgi:predicted LPLAT superfamily acyltransferase
MQQPELRTARLLLVLPTYNNAGSLKKVVLEASQNAIDILIVNDGSTDGTLTLLKEVTTNQARVHVVHHDINLGKGAAILTGFRYAQNNGYTHIITMDTDGQHSPADIPLFMEATKQFQKCILIGDRQLDLSSSPHIPRSSKFGRKFSDFWVKLETGTTVVDTQSGFRCYPLAQTQWRSLSTVNYDFEIEILVRSVWAGAQAHSLPISVVYPPRELRVSHFKPFLDNFRLSMLHTKLVCLSLFLRPFFALRRFAKREPASQERKGAALMPLLLSLFGVSFCYFISPFVVFFYFLSHRPSRKGVTQFYASLGVSSLFQQLALAFVNYRFFAISLIDRIAMTHQKMHPQFDEIVSKRPSGGALLIGSHIGDWTVSGFGFARGTKNRVAVVLDGSRTKHFQSLLEQTGQLGFQIIDAAQDKLSFLLAIKEALENDTLVCFLGDRVAEGTRAESVPFLGKLAPFPISIFELAVLFQKPVFTFHCIKKRVHPHSRFVLYCKEIWDGKSRTSAQNILRAYVGELEAMATRYPHFWFNFFDFWETESSSLTHVQQKEHTHAPNYGQTQDSLS